MTNHWIDIKNSDVILIMGSNAAENHPISFRWVTAARVAGARLINVDPRFTRTSSKADIYAPIRSGTDIAFLGGMLNYILQNRLIHETYVTEYTNAAYLVSEDFDFDTAAGVFSGYDETARKYDTSSWNFQADEDGVILRTRRSRIRGACTRSSSSITRGTTWRRFPASRVRQRRSWRRSTRPT